MAINGRLPILLMHLVWAHAVAGRKPDAEALGTELRAIAEKVGAPTFAYSYAALGYMDEAFRWLDRDIENRDYDISRSYSPGWNPIRGDPRFIDMLRRINYPAIEEFQATMQNAPSAETTRNPVD